jgi:CubicO group peptidase (beta-lactamase class C family)
MAEIHGHFDRRFSALADILSASIDAGTDVGASAAVTLDGEMVVDIWGGWANAQKTELWQADTLTTVWSCTKTITTLAALVLIERGELDVDKPVAYYWPEFGVNGKEAIAIRHILSHTSGVSGWEQPIQVTDLYDWEYSTARLAKQAPWWTPGTASGYHSQNFGHLIGEVIRRITTLKLGEFLAQEVTGPLGADFYIGLPDCKAPCTVNIIPPPVLPLPIDPETVDRNSISYKTFNGPAWEPTISWNPAWRKADIGAANGQGNARSLARLLSVIACGGEVDGVKLLSPKTCEQIFCKQSDGKDQVLGIQVQFGLGFALQHEVISLPPGRVGFWGGWGGSLALFDYDRRLSFSYVMNLMDSSPTGGDNGPNLLKATYAALSF